jgi:hypothetical protein
MTAAALSRHRTPLSESSYTPAPRLDAERGVVHGPIEVPGGRCGIARRHLPDAVHRAVKLCERARALIDAEGSLRRGIVDGMRPVLADVPVRVETRIGPRWG